MKVKAGVGSHFSFTERNQGAIFAAGDLSFMRSIVVEDRGEDAETLCSCEKLITIPDKSTCRKVELNGSDAVFIRIEKVHLSFAAVKFFNN